MSYPEGPQGGGWTPPSSGGGAWMPPPQDYYGYGQQPEQRRSSIPKVIGILMIIFGSLGLVFSLISFGMHNNFDDPSVKEAFGDKLSSIKTYDSFEKIMGLAISTLHLFAGIWAVMYKRAAPILAISYAVIKILMVVLSIVMFYSWMAPLLDKGPKEMKTAMGIGILLGGVIGMSWPVVIWALMSRPAARAACDR